MLDRFTARCVLKYTTHDIAAGICNLWPLIVHYVPSLSLRGDRRVSTSPPELQWGLRQRHKSKNFCCIPPVRFHGNNAFTPWRWECFWELRFWGCSNYSNLHFHVNGDQDSPDGEKKRLWTSVCCCTTPPTSGLTVKLQLSTYRVFFCNLCFIWKQWCFYRQGQHCNLKTVQISTGVYYLIQISRKCSSQHLNLSHLIRNIPDGSDNVEGWEGQTIVMTGAHVTRTTGGKLPV